MRELNSQRPSGWSPSPQQKQQLLDFEGYGPDNPDILFIGLEEHCDPDIECQRDRIWIRCNHSAFAEKRADRRTATEALTGDGEKSDVPAWKVMASIVSGLTGRSNSDEYKYLGTRPAQGGLTTFLTELRPMPRPGSNSYLATYLPDWFPEFKDRRDYERQAEEMTGRRILSYLKRSPHPKYVFFYGKPACEWATKHLASHLVGLLRPGNPSSKVTSIGETTWGSLVVQTGFYDGQHGASAFRATHVPSLVRELVDFQI